MTADSRSQGLWYSMRRYYVDSFHFQHVAPLPAGSRVVDLGGKKINKRGVFDISKYNVEVTCVNIAEETNPDVIADIADLPLPSHQFDVALFSEVLEHVSDPIPALKEAKRVLRPGGVLLICVPFLSRIHPDPCDYARYTDHWWRETLTTVGFANIEIKRQGYFWSVFVDLVREWTYQKSKGSTVWFHCIRRGLQPLVHWARRKAIQWDRNIKLQRHPSFGNYTTGFGIKACS